jgi:hypothetical protein
MADHSDQNDHKDISDICSQRINDSDINNDLIDSEEELSRQLNGKDEVKREIVLKCKVIEL